MSIGLRRLSIIPMMKIPEKTRKEASNTCPFAIRTTEIGTQTSIVPTAGMILNKAITAPQRSAPSMDINRSVKYPRKPWARATIIVPFIVARVVF